MLLKDHNYNRKAQRVDLPLLVQINEKVYKTKDWSVIGVSISELEGTYEKNAEIKSSLILPLQGANFVIPVILVLKNLQDNAAGCTFKDLSEKNKRILKRFIELAIDGKLDSAEDLIATYSEPVIDSPIHEALSLGDQEAAQIKTRFLKKSIAYIGAGIIIAWIIYYVVVYNFQYKIFTTGVVVGNTLNVTANNAGIIEKIYVNTYDELEKGYILFDILTTVEKEVQIAQPLDPKIEVLKKDLEAYSKNRVSNYEIPLIKALEERYKSRKEQYDNAMALYNKKLITKKDLNIINNNMITAKLELERNRMRTGMESENLKARILQLNQKINDLKIGRYLTKKIEVEEVKRRMTTVNGRVYMVGYKEREFVNPGDIVMILQTDEKPFVMMKLHIRDIFKININDTAIIFKKHSSKVYTGKIAQIGYSSVNPEVPVSQESSLNESIVKIEFDDDNVDFPINTRVEIRVERNFFEGIK